MLKTDIDQFLTEKQIGVVGASRNTNKFSNKVCQKLKELGYEIHLIHPEMESMNGDKCIPSVRQLPNDVQSLMLIASPDVCANVLSDVAGTNISLIWIFSGKGSHSTVEAAIERLRGNGVSVISGFCPFMFLEPVTSIHSIHRFFVRLAGNYPK